MRNPVKAVRDRLRGKGLTDAQVDSLLAIKPDLQCRNVWEVTRRLVRNPRPETVYIAIKNEILSSARAADAAGPADFQPTRRQPCQP
jgi:hypothetical protein